MMKNLNEEIDKDTPEVATVDLVPDVDAKSTDDNKNREPISVPTVSCNPILDRAM